MHGLRCGEHGDWCPGYQRDGHLAGELTVDHVVPLAAGGAPFDIGNTAAVAKGRAAAARIAAGRSAA